MKVHLARPDIRKEDIDGVTEVLRSPMLSLGPRHKRFQDMFAGYIGARHAVAVSSGTAALHLILLSLGIGKGDEVVTTPYSFIASANCILFTGARPVFADIDPETFNIDPDEVERRITKRTRAILAVHVFGLPADMERLRAIARRRRIFLIEDACEAVGARINGVKVGNFSDAAAFGFYPNKQITTGEGGMIVTDNRDIALRCAMMSNQGRNTKGEFAGLGYNFRISDINCALGISQLKRIGWILKRRKKLAELYSDRLSGLSAVIRPCEKEGYERSWFVYVVKLGDDTGRSYKERLIRRLARSGVECGRYFEAIHLTPFYKKAYGYVRGRYPMAESAADRTFALPFYNGMKEKELDYVCRSLKESLR